VGFLNMMIVRDSRLNLLKKDFGKKKESITHIFSLMVKLTTIKFVLGIITIEYLHLKHLVIKTTFLHGDLKKDIYIKQSQGFLVKGKENLVCKLKNDLIWLETSS